MFLLQQKPVVTFRNARPEPHLYDISEPEELENAITYALSKPQELMDQIQRYTEQVHPYKDGCSSARVLQAVDGALAANQLSPKPINLIRNWKARRKLGYWGFR